MGQSLINFLPYQQADLRDDSRFKIKMQARQTGKTFSACAEVVEDCIKAEIEGRRARWVILSRGERQAKEAMDEAVKPMCKAFYIVYRDLLKNMARPEFYEDTFKDSRDINYKSLEVLFPGGSRISALPANPDTARGYSANVLLDEFAFHDNSRKIWAALFPVITRNEQKLRICSTPNGKGNQFYDIWTTNDPLGPVWSKHLIDIHEAVKQGLAISPEELKRALNNEEAWRQEFLLEFLDEATAWLSYDLITANEHPDAGKPELYTGGPCYIGNDIARRRDLWVAWVLEMLGDVRWTREVVALRNATFAEQDAVLDELMQKYQVVRLAMDQTGMGEKPVEDAKKRYGRHLVEGVIFTGPTQLNMATASKEIFEDRLIRLPQGNTDIRGDLHNIKKVVGPTGNPRIITDRDSNGHADHAWACFLANAASCMPVQSYGVYTAMPYRFSRTLQGYLH